MAKVNIDINGRKYALGCDDGEEERLHSLASLLNARIAELANQFGQIGDQRLLVMAGITMIDEIEEMKENLEGQAQALTDEIRKESEESLAEARKTEMTAADALADAARRIEKLAERLSDHS
ncbi:MAG TPA: cell division protein ZapA [Hellea balneolensis]|uniref:Cell division protein ZapA n=1 Tax=Hellea balneolensis TaxID=287478 RepID=A0A7C5R4F3_9PROT|nr:cell division protein ZapA [Hellea balneolensis]